MQLSSADIWGLADSDMLSPLINQTVGLRRYGQRTAVLVDVVSVWCKRLVDVGVQRHDMREIDKLQTGQILKLTVCHVFGGDMDLKLKLNYSQKQ